MKKTATPVEGASSPWAELFAKRPQTIKPGLARVRQAMAALDLARQLPPTVLIGGTNGKGSTSGLLWHLWAALGLPAGLYTSPHLSSFAERIQMGHVDTTEALLLAELRKLQAELPHALYEEMSFFEVTTVLALRVFVQHACQLLVLEVGLGGRWDATNAVEPLASAIVSIDRDHEDWLGNTLAKIATEKFGIARPGKPLFWGERHEAEKPEVAEVREQMSARLGLDITAVGRDFVYDAASERISLKLAGLKPWQASLPPWLASAPRFLRHNFALSLALFYKLAHEPALLQHLPSELNGRSAGELADIALARFGTPEVAWPPSLLARFQRLAIRAPDSELIAHELLVDVCHNPAAAGEFAGALRESGLVSPKRAQLPALVSVLGDKDVNGFLDVIRAVAAPLVLFQVPSPRSWQRCDLAARHADLMLFEDFAKAWEYAYTSWNKAYGEPWLVCGSFLAVDEVVRYFSAYPHNRRLPQTLTGRLPSDGCEPS